MNTTVYNLSLLVGLLLVGVGVGLWNLPAGLVVGGALLILLTIFNALLVARMRGR